MPTEKRGSPSVAAVLAAVTVVRRLQCHCHHTAIITIQRGLGFQSKRDSKFKTGCRYIADAHRERQRKSRRAVLRRTVNGGWGLSLGAFTLAWALSRQRFNGGPSRNVVPGRKGCLLGTQNDDGRERVSICVHYLLMSFTMAWRVDRLSSHRETHQGLRADSHI